MDNEETIADKRLRQIVEDQKEIGRLKKELEFAQRSAEDILRYLNRDTPNIEGARVMARRVILGWPHGGDESIPFEDQLAAEHARWAEKEKMIVAANLTDVGGVAH